MFDQANDLRRLAMRANWPQPEGEGPRLLVVAGGQRAIGATTLAVELSQAWAADALRVVLMDANLYDADVAARCGVPASGGMGDVLLARRNIHEALQRGPGSIQVLTGNGGADARLALTETVHQRLRTQIQTLTPHVDWVVADTGDRPGSVASWLWSMAERVLLVTTPQPDVVMNTYAHIKTHVRRSPVGGRIDLIVRNAGRDLAEDVHRRIDRSCRRFLGLEVGLVPPVMDTFCEPTPSAAAVEKLARYLLETTNATDERAVA